MNIETYEVEEVKGELGTMAADSEAMELIEKLGLEGQKALCNKETDTRFPYRRMTQLEFFVYRQHLPETTRLEQYKSGLIPLRVLQVAAHAKECGYLSFIEVWHPEDVRVDPLLVGVKGESWNGERYLLARWGESLKPFQDLQKEAIEIWKATASSKLGEIQKEVESEIRRLDQYAQRAALTGKVQTFTFYSH